VGFVGLSSVPGGMVGAGGVSSVPWRCGSLVGLVLGFLEAWLVRGAFPRSPGGMEGLVGISVPWRCGGFGGIVLGLLEAWRVWGAGLVPLEVWRFQGAFPRSPGGEAGSGGPFIGPLEAWCFWGPVICPLEVWSF